MAVLLEYSFSGCGTKSDESIVSSSCSSIETKADDMHGLFCFRLNDDDERFDLSSQEFYENVSMASTPSVVRSSELQQKHDYDTDDSGFCESLVSDSDLLQMSNLCLRDESYSESTTNSSRRSDAFQLPKLCLLSHFDGYCDNEAKTDANVSPTFHEQCETTRKKTEVVETLLSERISVRRQRSPEAVVERCSRHRLSLDSFSECRSEDCRPVRRSDSFIPTHFAEEMHASTQLDDSLQSSLPSPILDELLQANLSSPSVSDEPVTAVANVPHKKPSNNNKLLEPTPVVDRVFSPSLSVQTDGVIDLSPVADVDEVVKEGLQSILAKFAPPCLDQLIGRKMGLDYVDIISELCDRSMSLIIRHICSYLSDSDLLSLLLVSVKWSCIIADNRHLMSRVKSVNSRHQHITKLHSKENVSKPKTSTRTVVTRTSTSTTAVNVVTPLICLASLTNRTSDSDTNVNKTLSSCSRRTVQFWKEAGKLYDGETLTKCPRCRGPSRTDSVQERGRCKSVSCQFDFCLMCLMTYHNAQRCRTATSATSIARDSYIGSRKSRRQLRRL